MEGSEGEIRSDILHLLWERQGGPLSLDGALSVSFLPAPPGAAGPPRVFVPWQMMGELLSAT